MEVGVLNRSVPRAWCDVESSLKGPSFWCDVGIGWHVPSVHCEGGFH